MPLELAAGIGVERGEDVHDHSGSGPGIGAVGEEFSFPIGGSGDATVVGMEGDAEVPEAVRAATILTGIDIDFLEGDVGAQVDGDFRAGIDGGVAMDGDAPVAVHDHADVPAAIGPQRTVEAGICLEGEVDAEFGCAGGDRGHTGIRDPDAVQGLVVGDEDGGRGVLGFGGVRDGFAVLEPLVVDFRVVTVHGDGCDTEGGGPAGAG